jgi:hypothetical protein
MHGLFSQGNNGKEETPQGGKEAQEREASREAPPLAQNSPVRHSERGSLLFVIGFQLWVIW